MTKLRLKQWDTEDNSMKFDQNSSAFYLTCHLGFYPEIIFIINWIFWIKTDFIFVNRLFNFLNDKVSDGFRLKSVLFHFLIKNELLLGFWEYIIVIIALIDIKWVINLQ
jgi:hypothetical protein